MTESNKKLYQAACAARENSYSPYSQCAIGAAVLMEDGTIHSGTNVENVVNGISLCAERAAIAAAICAGGKSKIKEIMVVGLSDPAWVPCGVCRQAIAEFGTPDTLIHASNLKGNMHTCHLSDLLPQGYYPSMLNQGLEQGHKS